MEDVLKVLLFRATLPPPRAQLHKHRRYFSEEHFYPRTKRPQNSNCICIYSTYILPKECTMYIIVYTIGKVPSLYM